MTEDIEGEEVGRRLKGRWKDTHRESTPRPGVLRWGELGTFGEQKEAPVPGGCTGGARDSGLVCTREIWGFTLWGTESCWKGFKQGDKMI